MPDNAPRIYAVVPQGLSAAGGISRMAAYYAQDWQDSRRSPAMVVIDSYGPRDIWHMPLHFTAACLRILIDGLRGRIALLHLHMAEDGSTLRKGVLLLLGRALGVPVVLHVHGARFAQSCARLPGPLARLLAAVVARADLVLVLGGTSRRFLIEQLRIPATKVAVLPNAVPDPRTGAPRPATAGCRLLFLGALGTRKGVDVLLAALASPHLAGSDWHADIAGNGDLAPWQAIAGQLGIAHRVTWHGWQPRERSQALLAGAGILVLPSRYEGLPMAVLEAMAAGVPVIATPVGDVADAVEQGVTGLLVAPGSADALAEALAALIADPPRRHRMGQAGRARFEVDFAIDAFGAHLSALLGELVARPQVRRRGLRNAAYLWSGAAAGQATAMLAAPLLTRLYPAEAFGSFGLFSGIVSTLGAVATLKFEQAIVLEKSRAAAAHALRLCMVLSLCAALAVLALAQFSDGPIRGLLRMWGAPAVFTAGLVNALSAWGVRQGRFRALAAYQSCRSGFAVALQLAGAALGRSTALLVGGQVAGQAMATAFLAADRQALAVLCRGWRCSALLAVVRRHRHMALFGAPQTLGHLLSVNLPTILLPLCFGPAEGGMFWLAYRILILPSQILVESMRGVFLRRAAALAGAPPLARRAMRTAMLQLGAISLPVVAVLLAGGPALFALVFGEAWRPAGVDAALMAVPWWLETVAMPCSVLVVVLRLQRSYLVIEMASLAARAAAILAGAWCGSAELAVALYAAAAALSSIALMILSSRSTDR